MVALLAHRFADLDLADDCVQEALTAAITDWPRNGVPDNVAAWLLTVARRRALDRLRAETSAQRRTRAAAADLVEQAVPADRRGLIEEGDTVVHDERLRLVLLCCHPALNRDAQTALTLRLVGGLTTAQIAAAYLIPESTASQRILRAKQKIRSAAMPLTIPAQLDERVDVVLTVIYLIFNEGYLARGEQPLRVDLADEAIRLARTLTELLPDSPEVGGLLALMLFQRARFAGRVDDDGELVLLQHQDRSLWDRPMIAEGSAVLTAALGRRRLGSYQLQAWIAGLHALAPSYEQTDWTTIVAAYDLLAATTGSSVVRLNRAVAVGQAEGPRAGLEALAELMDAAPGDGSRGGGSELANYHLLHASRGDLLERAGEVDAAREAFERAAELAPGPAERRLLLGRIDELRRP